MNEKKQKKAHTLNQEREDGDDEGGEERDDEQEADAYQHVKQAKKNDLQVNLLTEKS